MPCLLSLHQRCTSEILALTDPGVQGFEGATLVDPRISWRRAAREVVPEDSQRIR